MYFSSFFDSGESEDAEQLRHASGSDVQDQDSDDGSGQLSVSGGATGGSTGGGSRDKRKKLELRRVTSKRYRDTLGGLYAELEALVPSVYPNAKPRTKSQIIQVTGDAIRKLKQEVAALDAQYILSSPYTRNKWIEKVVHSGASFVDVTSLFMRLMVHAGWSFLYTEMWSTRNVISCSNTDEIMSSGQSNSAQGRKEIGNVHNQFQLRAISSTYDDRPQAVPPALSALVASSRESMAHAGDASLVGRIASSRCPDCVWFEDGQTPSAYANAQVALRAGFKFCSGLPLVVRGEVVTVVLLYGQEYSEATRAHFGVAEDTAAAIGNCYGAVRNDDVVERQSLMVPPPGTSSEIVPSSSISGENVTLASVGSAVAVSSSRVQSVPFAHKNYRA